MNNKVYIVIYRCGINEEWDIQGVFYEESAAEEFAANRRSLSMPFEAYDVEEWEVRS